MAAQKLILGAVNHILNNFLNHFLIIRINLEKNTPIEKNTLDMLDQSVADVSEKLRVLELLDNPEKKSKLQKYLPQLNYFPVRRRAGLLKGFNVKNSWSYVLAVLH